MTVTGPRGSDAQFDSLLAVAEETRRGSRRDGTELRPLGPKAARTRSALIHAGIEVFCELGYASSSVEDVHRRAGVSLGTFYQYFRDKAELIATIVADVVISSADRIFCSFEAEQGEDSVTEVVDGFVRHYAATADFQRVWEEATHLEPLVAELRRRMSALLEARLAEAIAAGQERAVVDARLDPTLAARALSAMVDRTCYLTFVVDRRGRRAVAGVVASLSQIWVNALALEPR